MNSAISTRVAALRALLKKHRLAAWIEPSGDPHGSEYVADRWQGRRWLTGFDGSAGTAVVTRRQAGLWTDSRYWLAAGKALRGTPFRLFRAGAPGVPSPEEWLARALRRGESAALSGEIVPLSRFRTIGSLLGRAGVSLRGDLDLLGEIWTDRPAVPARPIWLHEVRWAGRTRRQKMKEVRARVAERGADWLLVSDLSETAWIFNIRGEDIPYCPIAVAYALLGPASDRLFVDGVKVSPEIRRALERDAITLAPYGSIGSALRSLPSRARVLADPDSVSVRLARVLRRRLVEAPSPITKLKALKNEVEAAGFRNALRRDGVALAKFFVWLERAVGRERLTEGSAAAKLHGFRAAQSRFVHDSFGAIVGYQANAALPHYRPGGASDSELRPKGVLLVDSGGTYLDGTTDTTRVVALGPVPARVRRAHTLLLKGVIALSRLRFPRGTSGVQVDAFARQFLWESGLDYGHGTGHGVGFCLNVHEGPQAFRTRNSATEIAPGMVTTIEPGYYVSGDYGLRIENMTLCRPAGDGFLGFETLTVCPISLDLVDPSLLTRDETRWLNAYHARVFREISPALEGTEIAWLRRNTRAI